MEYVEDPEGLVETEPRNVLNLSALLLKRASQERGLGAAERKQQGIYRPEGLKSSLL